MPRQVQPVAGRCLASLRVPDAASPPEGGEHLWTRAHTGTL